MLDYKDILNKHFVLRLSAREISRQTGVSKSGILKFLQAFEKCEDLDYPLPSGITNAGIAMKVYGKVPGEGGRDESYSEYAFSTSSSIAAAAVGFDSLTAT